MINTGTGIAPARNSVLQNSLNRPFDQTFGPFNTQAPMRKDIIKKVALALVLVGSSIVGLSATANAQGRSNRDRGSGPVEATGNIDRNRNGIDDRYEAQGQVDLNQNGIPDNQEGYRGRGRSNNGGNRAGTMAVTETGVTTMVTPSVAIATV
jgi:hypothetical protein